MRRFGVVLSVWALGVAGVLGAVLPVSASAMVPALASVVAVTTPGGFTSLAPARLLDTRTGVGAAKVAVAAHGTVHLQVTGRGGVPATGVSAVVLNVTVTAPTAPGFVTVYGDGTALPTASNLNFVKAQTVPNLVIAPVGANGKVALFNGSGGTVQLIGDVSGYYRAGAPTVAGAFGSLAPARLLDTRTGVGAAKVAVAAHGTVHLQVTGRGGVPASGVSAVVLNVTVTAPAAPGFVTVYGDGTALPTASNLNFVKGQTVPNLVIAPVGANGKVALYNGSGGTVQLIGDVSGYYLAGVPSVAGAFGSLAPARLLDTRIGVGAAKVAVAAHGTVHLQVTGRGGVPASGVSAVVLNVTVTAPTSSGFVTVYGDGTALPTASNLNFVKAQTVPNLVIAPVGANGKVALYNGSAGTVQLIGDVAGWFLNTTAMTTPGPVTTVTATPASTSIALSWTNPTSPSLTGVMIRRAAGATAPASATAGILVVDAAKPATSYTNTGLVSGTQYSYALFAHNGTPVYAAAAKVTTTTTVGVRPSITGTVTDAGGIHHGLANVTVDVSSASTGAVVHATTTTSGSYTVTGLPAGTYTVCFTASGATGGSSDATGYVAQCYKNQPTSELGTPTQVSVTVGATATGINAALLSGGAVSGIVTDAGGIQHGLGNVLVSVSSYSLLDGGTAVTNASGSYTVTGLAAGTDYQVCFTVSGATGGSSDATGYINQCYNNQPTKNTSTPVAVTVGSTKTGIDAALAVGGAISGNVTEAGGIQHGLGNVRVDVSSYSLSDGGTAMTTADGSYTVTGMAAGSDYQVCFSGSAGTGGTSDAFGYLRQCYDNQMASGTPTPVTVTLGATKTGVNAALAVAGAVSGTVSDAGGTHHGLANVQVEVSSVSVGVHGYATTAANGSYTVTGLEAGPDYQVCFYGSGAAGGSSDALGYFDECYDNQTAPGTPTLVAVTLGATKTGVNAALAVAGAVSGTVTDAGGTHHGLAGVSVYVSSTSAGSFGYAMTAADGTWLVPGLAAETDYKVCFTAIGGDGVHSAAAGGSVDSLGYVDQCYNNQPTSATATPVTVTLGATRTGINAALAAAGAVSGTVTDAGGAHQGLSHVSVEVRSPSTGASGAGDTAADGSYTVTGLPAGTDYTVCFTTHDAAGGSSDAVGYLDECYNNQPTSDVATPVVVTTGMTSAGVNAALGIAGAISGNVTDAGGTHHGLENVWVNVVSASTGVYGYAQTATNGIYTVRGLPAGTDYQVCFQGSSAMGGSSDTLGYVDQCYDNQPTSDTANPVVVTLGATQTGIDAVLAGHP